MSILLRSEDELDVRTIWGDTSYRTGRMEEKDMGTAETDSVGWDTLNPRNIHLCTQLKDTL
jgi:hypothetical protein